MIEEHFFTPPSASEDYISGLLPDADGGTDYASVVLSGGRSIIPVLSALEKAGRRKLAGYRFFLADERIGADYNQEMLKERLFNSLLSEGAVTEDQLLFPDITLSAEAAAEEYAERLKKIDIAFLGVGEDGHVASLFPGHDSLHSKKLVEAVHNSPKPPPKRITLTLRAFSTAAAVVLMFFGEEKRGAYLQFKKVQSYAECPAAFFKQAGKVYILHDQEF